MGMKELLLKVSEILMLRKDLLSRTLSLNLMELGNFPKIILTLLGTFFISVYILRTFRLRNNISGSVLKQPDLPSHERDCFQTKGRLPIGYSGLQPVLPTNLKAKERGGEKFAGALVTPGLQGLDLQWYPFHQKAQEADNIPT